MIIPLHVATRGLISNNLPLGIATDGLLYIPVPVTPVRPGGFGRYGYYEEDWRRKDREILEDDQEILEMLSLIMPTLQ